MLPRPKRLFRTIRGALFGRPTYVCKADARHGSKSIILPPKATTHRFINFIEVSNELQTMDRVVFVLRQRLRIKFLSILLVQQLLPPWEQECIHNELEPGRKCTRCRVRDGYARSSSFIKAFSSSIETHLTSHTSFLFRFKSTWAVIKRM